MSKQSFKISGLHCSSCKLLLESELAELPGVKKIKVDYPGGKATIEYSETETNLDKIFDKIKNLNYTPELALGKQEKKPINKKFIWGGLFIFIFITGIILINTLGGWDLLANLNDGNVGYGLIFLIGLLASFHCVGMCGGFIIAYSTSQLKKEKATKNYKLHLQYNLGRLISYTIIGGILGGVGSFFGVNPIFSGSLLIVAAIFMVLMGLSLATNIKWLEKIKIKTPDFIAKIIFKNRNQNKTPKSPFIIGLLTGLMPCGPLQAMQLYALSTGDWLTGALSMAVYVLGTIPVLFSFGSFVSLLTGSRIKQLLKISGVIVILLGLFTLSRGLDNFNLFQAKEEPIKTAPATNDNSDYQIVNMSVTYAGYQPNVIHIKAGQPVKWIIDSQGATGCTSGIILYNGSQQISRQLSGSQDIIEFTPATGLTEIKFSCGMRMVWGKFIIDN